MDCPVEPRPPQPFVIIPQTELDDWKKWQKSFRCYANAVNLHQKCHDVQLQTFKSLVGPDALEIYNTFSLSDIVDVESVMRKFDDHFKPKVNVTVERYELYKMRQKPGQTFDNFLDELINQIGKCEFHSTRDEIALYKIVGGIANDDVRKALLADGNLKYDEAVRICRASAAEHFMLGSQNVSAGSARIGSVKANLSKPQVQNKKESTNIAKLKTRSSAKKAHNSGSAAQNFPCEKILNVNDAKQNEQAMEGSDEDGSLKDGGDDDWRADDDGGSTIVKNGGHRAISKPRSKYQCKVETHPCEVCGKAFSRKRALERHAAIHIPQQSFTCHYCEGRFRLKYYLIRHMVRVHADVMGTTPKVYSCKDCEYKTTVGPNMRRHRFQHTEDKPFACQLCDYKCIVRQLMTAHMAKHTGERPFTCNVCDKGFTESCALKKHMVTHLSPEEQVKHREALAKHRNRIAGLSSNVEVALQHKRSVDTNSCETCGKFFSSKAALKAHSIIHTGEKPFACKYCDYRSAHKSALMTHMNIKHTTEKPFVCSVCGYACKLKAALQSHMNIHSGDRPFACKVCNSKFRQSAHLSVHMRTHTGEKPFVCDICGHRWALQSNLRQHMKIHLNQSRDPSQYSPPRKRRKKAKNPEPPGEPSLAPNAIPQWSEQVSTINPMECFPPLETPTPFHPSYASQSNPRLPTADCRFYEQRHWTSQTQDLAQNPINTGPVAIMRSTQPNL